MSIDISAPFLARVDREGDATASRETWAMYDSIIPLIIAIGERIKSLEKHLPPEYLLRHEEVDWRGAKGARDFLAHEYFEVDYEILYDIATLKIPTLRNAIREVRSELEREAIE